MSRYLSLDLAKGFTVLFIPVVHTVLLYASPDAHNTFMADVLAFIAEWPGAQVFMFIMGSHLAFSKRSMLVPLKRAGWLLGAGYVLNALKFLLPLRLGFLPQALIGELQFAHERPLPLNLLIMGDILHFAAIAIVVLALIKALHSSTIIALVLTYLVLSLSPFFWDLHSSNAVADYCLQLIGGGPADAFFPLFPWLVYPLAGFVWGRCRQQPCFSNKLFFFIGAYFMGAAMLIQLTPFHLPGASFYRTWPDGTLMHLGFVLVWISVWCWIASLLQDRPRHYFAQLLSFCSRHITLIYLLHWPLIIWLLPLFGYGALNEWQAMAAATFITALVLGIAYMVEQKFFRK